MASSKRKKGKNGRPDADDRTPDDRKPPPRPGTLIPGPAGATSDPADSLGLPEDEWERLLEQDITRLVREQPEIFEDMFEAMSEWHQEFVREHGREPSDEDLKEAVGLENLDEEELEDFLEGLAEEEIEELIALTRDADGILVADISDLSPELQRLLATCPWCGAEIGSEDPVFGFGVRFPLAQDVGTRTGTYVFTIRLLSKKRELHMILAADDSEAKRDGWDGMVMACSRECARHLKQALAAEDDLDGMIQDN